MFASLAPTTTAAPFVHPWAGTGERSLHTADAAEAATLSARAKAAKPFTGDWGFRHSLVEWSRHASPRLLVLTTLVLMAARWVGAPLGWADLAVFAVLFAWEPFNEWIIHAYLLHLKPRTIGPTWLKLGWDLPMARRHRSHHANPWDLSNLFIPIGAVLFSIAFHSAIFFAILPTHLAITALISITIIGIIYEWTHYMAHIPYRPRLSFMRLLQQRHRLHHFKNERFWLGVSSNFGDRVLNTLPDGKEVEASPTARLLQR
ncbi:MAG: fatty acid hydroxylase family protein [Myxococcales bacterium]|nr:fatty acid hydroxylase family protein [Myxococcales bacterium]